MANPEGFLTPDGRLVFSIRYFLESEPPKILELIVPLDRDGNAMNRLALAADPKKRIVEVQPGEEIRFRGERFKVKAVEAYRWVQYQYLDKKESGATG